MPCFDCRTFVVPTLTEACNTVLWRQRDAVKNAISMAAQSMFSHKRLQHKSGPQMQEMMHTEKGVNFNDFPAPFKRGMFARRVKSLRVLSEQELSKIPEKHRLTGPVERSSIELVDIWLAKHVDPVRVLFLGDPIVAVRAVEKGRSPEETSVASV